MNRTPRPTTAQFEALVDRLDRLEATVKSVRRLAGQARPSSVTGNLIADGNALRHLVDNLDEALEDEAELVRDQAAESLERYQAERGQYLDAPFDQGYIEGYLAGRP